MLSLHAVNHYYGSQHILWNVNLELQPGACTSVMGLPGMGKTTLVNCITGYQAIESGSICWQLPGGAAQSLLDLTPPLRAAMGIGYVPQDKRIFSQMTVEENLQIAMLAGSPVQYAVSSDIYDLLPALSAVRQVMGAALSEEEQYQLALARALVTGPKLLILDEPTRGMEQSVMHRLGEFILRLKSDLGLPVLLAEQHLSFIRSVADRFCLLHRGRSGAQGCSSQLNYSMLEDFMPQAPAR